LISDAAVGLLELLADAVIVADFVLQALFLEIAVFVGDDFLQAAMRLDDEAAHMSLLFVFAGRLLMVGPCDCETLATGALFGKWIIDISGIDPVNDLQGSPS
jgi:hypothetical protein